MRKRTIKRPPRIATWMLKSILPFHAASHGPGDYEEIYRRMARQEGTFKAQCWYGSQVCRSTLPFLVNSIYWRVVMFKNYLKIAVRNIVKHKAYSFINIIGLALGMASCILIFSYVLYELSFDRYHENADRIYRLGLRGRQGEKVISIALSNAPTAPALIEEYPEVENAVRFYSAPKTLVEYGDKRFYDEGILYADKTVFDVFSWPMLKGNPNTALTTAYSVVITAEMAEKYFGDEDPMNKTIRFNDQEDYTVMGVIDHIPLNSHFRFTMLCSFETMYAQNREHMEGWVPFNYATYILLREGQDYKALEDKFPAFIEKHMASVQQALGGALEYLLQPMTQIHLHSTLEYDFSDHSDITYIYLFIAIAVFILLIACINFMNLATARSSKRAQEIGLRKTFGSNRGKLLSQFFGETMLYSLFAFLLAMTIAYFTLPVFSSISGRSLSLHYSEFPWFLPGLILLTVFVGLAAGSYPALLLSSFQPARIFKGRIKTGGWGLRFRNGLVVFQFAISIFLIIGTGTIVDQLHYMKNKRLGFDREHVIVLRIRRSRIQESVQTFKTDLERFHGIASVAVTNHVPVELTSTDACVPDGYPEGQSSILIRSMAADEDLIPTLKLELAAGRNFSEEFTTDEDDAVIINETAVERFGWDDPIGESLHFRVGSGLDERDPKTVIGVVKDFHIQSLHRPIEPLYISNNVHQLAPNYLLVRIKVGSIPSTLAFLKETWQRTDPDRPFDYSFLDDQLDNLYRAEVKLRTIFSYFTGFAIFIACLGLFGLASFTAEQRTKEIGIRKVLGSSIVGILFLLIKEFTKWVVVANIVAWPLAYFALHRWLQHFAYRTDMSLYMFLLSGILALLIALITVGYQAVKAARANPVMSLRYE